MTEVWYKVEAWIPPEEAIGGTTIGGYWTQLNGDDGHPFRTENAADATKAYHRARIAHGVHNVRLVRVTEEVVS